MYSKLTVIVKWLIGLAVQLVLLQSSLELIGSEDEVVLEGVRSQEVPGGEEPAAGRVVLFLVGGLRADIYNYRANGTGFYWLLKNSLGVSGLAQGSSLGDRDLRLKELLRGVAAGPGADDLESLATHSRLCYVGPPLSVAGLRNTRSFPPSWDNITLCPFPTQLDGWVLRTARDVLLNDSQCNLLLVYFPGLDLASRLEGLYSNLTVEELFFIVNSIENIYRLSEEKNENKTSYILTGDIAFPPSLDAFSDYTLRTVPLVTWGSGLAKRRYNQRQSSFDRNVKMNDIAPLVSTLLGVPIPAHSEGILPLHCLADESLQAKLSLKNSEQICLLMSQFEKVFGHFWAEKFSQLPSSGLKSYLRVIQNSIEAGDFSAAIVGSQWIIELSMFGISYYTNFNPRHITVSIFLSLLGWIGVLSGWILSKVKLTLLIEPELSPDQQQDSSAEQPPRNMLRRLKSSPFLIDVFCVLIFSTGCSVLFLTDFPSILIPSCILLLAVLWLVARSIPQWVRLSNIFRDGQYRSSRGKVMIHMLYFLGWTLGISYTIFHNVAFIWAIVFSSLTDLRRKLKPYSNFWILSSLPFILMFFFDREEFSYLIIPIAGSIWICLSFILSIFSSADPLAWIYIVACNLIIIVSSFRKQYEIFLGRVEFLAPWALIAMLLMIPIIGSSKLTIRLLEITLGLSACIFYFSTGYEPVALAFILLHIFSWMLIEGYDQIFVFLSSTTKRMSGNNLLSWPDFRIAFYSVAYDLITAIILDKCSDLNFWPKGKVSYSLSSLGPITSGLSLLFPMILIVNVAGRIARRNVSADHLDLKMVILSFASLVHFTLFPRSKTVFFIQLVFSCSLLAEPFSYLLLCQSLKSRLTAEMVKTVKMGHVEPKDKSEESRL